MTLPVAGDKVAAGPIPTSNAELLTLIKQLQAQIAELQRKTLFAAGLTDGQLLIQGTGSIRVIDADGDENFFLGGFTGALARPDGEPQRVFVVRDDNGTARIAVWDPDPLTFGYGQAIYMWDHLGNIVMSTDVNGGLARPWVPVVMYPKFTTSSSTWSYMTIDNGLTHVEKQLWEGRVTNVSHPRLQLDGVWGIASGTSGTPVYNLKINGVVVDSWSQAGLLPVRRNPVDISAWLGAEFAQIELTVTASGTGAQIAAQVLGCTLRQT